MKEDSVLIPKILEECHDSKLGGHNGVLKTSKRIAKYLFWPRIDKRIKDYIRECLICQQMKPTNHKPFGLLVPLSIPSKVRQGISMDFIIDLPKLEVNQ